MAEEENEDLDNIQENGNEEDSAQEDSNDENPADESPEEDANDNSGDMNEESEDSDGDISDDDSDDNLDLEEEDGDGDTIVLKDGEDIFEEDEGELEDVEEKPSIKERIKEKFRDPKVLFSIALLFLGSIFVYLFINFSSDEAMENPYSDADLISQSLQEKDIIKQDLEQNSIEKLITKATILYQEGEKEKSLDIFNEVAIYNESLSWYNLGVARIKQKDYENALVAFKKALNSNEHRCESAINAAVSSLILGDKRGFERYIEIAFNALSERVSSPIYPYLYTIINHYRDKPFQVVVGANVDTISEYNNHKHRVAAKSFLMLEDAKSAIDHLELAKTNEDLLTLGMLYARIGDYDNAKEKLEQAIREKLDVNRSKEALLLTELKTGELSSAGETIESVIKNKGELGEFPIKSKLKKRLFDIDLAQKYFSKNILLDREVFLGTLFYFTPYQILDQARTLKLIKKGELSINGNDIEEAKNYLLGSATLSGIHGSLILGVRLAINNRLIDANDVFKKVEENYRSHDVLEYNLALSYAQLGNYNAAYTHFKRAYFLNKNNHMAGVFTVITSTYSGEDESANMKELLEYFGKRDDDESRFYLAILNFYSDNLLAFARWLESDKKDDPRYILLDIFTADKLERFNTLKEKTSRLRKMYPNEFLSNILDIYADNRKYTIKQKAFGFQDFMQADNFDKEAIYYGSPAVRDLYVKLGLLTGNLRKIRQHFQDKLAVEVNNPKGLIQGLAKINVYLGYFEEAFSLYNSLIDEQNVRDSNTLLQASVAAIGAGHKENAIALLELAIMQNRRNFEARYGLALLYMEIGNYEGAAIQLSNVDDGVHESDYYDFDLVNK